MSLEPIDDLIKDRPRSVFKPIANGDSLRISEKSAISYDEVPAVPSSIKQKKIQKVNYRRIARNIQCNCST